MGEGILASGVKYCIGGLALGVFASALFLDVRDIYYETHPSRELREIRLLERNPKPKREQTELVKGYYSEKEWGELLLEIHKI
jgi:hypothetical protein